jgi:hypothetical protein
MALLARGDVASLVVGMVVLAVGVVGLGQVGRHSLTLELRGDELWVRGLLGTSRFTPGTFSIGVRLITRPRRVRYEVFVTSGVRSVGLARFHEHHRAQRAKAHVQRALALAPAERSEAPDPGRGRMDQVEVERAEEAVRAYLSKVAETEAAVRAWKAPVAVMLGVLVLYVIGAFTYFSLFGP